MKTIKLVYSPSFTDKGPIVEMKNGNIVFRYDFENEDGKVHWTRIVFKTVYAYKYVESEYVNITDYKFGLVEIEDSLWIKQLLEVWVNDYGRKYEDAFGGKGHKIHHFRLYVDDDGLHEIICREIEISVES